MNSILDLLTLTVIDSIHSAIAETSNSINAWSTLTFLSGGAMGSLITIVVNYFKSRIQIMECCYIEDDIISKLPVILQTGEVKNIYSKRFLLKNTTNKDVPKFKVIFQFDSSAQIIKCTDNSKIGTDKHFRKQAISNEIEVTIKNFNRKDTIEFLFEIANILKHDLNITEADAIGFKIKIKDKRKIRSRSKLSIVEKAKLTPVNNNTDQ